MRQDAIIYYHCGKDLNFNMELMHHMKNNHTMPACKHFQKGRCTLFGRCWYKYEINLNSGASKVPIQATKPTPSTPLMSFLGTSTLLCTPLHCSVLLCTVKHYSSLFCAILHCSALFWNLWWTIFYNVWSWQLYFQCVNIYWIDLSNNLFSKNTVIFW